MDRETRTVPVRCAANQNPMISRRLFRVDSIIYKRRRRFTISAVQIGDVERAIRNDLSEEQKSKIPVCTKANKQLPIGSFSQYFIHRPLTCQKYKRNIHPHIPICNGS